MNKLPIYMGSLIFIIGCIVACSKVGRKEDSADLSKTPPTLEEKVDPVISECKNFEIKIVGENEIHLTCMD